MEALRATVDSDCGVMKGVPSTILWTQQWAACRPYLPQSGWLFGNAKVKGGHALNGGSGDDANGAKATQGSLEKLRVGFTVGGDEGTWQVISDTNSMMHCNGSTTDKGSSVPLLRTMSASSTEAANKGWLLPVPVAITLLETWPVAQDPCCTLTKGAIGNGFMQRPRPHERGAPQRKAVLLQSFFEIRDGYPGLHL